MGAWTAFFLSLLSITTEKCCENGLCFSNKAPFDDMPLPKCPEEIQPDFKLYSRDSWDNDTRQYEPLKFQPGHIPTSFNGGRRTIFIIHGYMHEVVDNRNPHWDKHFMNKFIQKDDVNVVLVGWSNGSRDVLYAASASNTRAVGAQVALVARSLVEEGGAARDRLWCVGHSLGAHVCGHAGQAYKLGRITGLDPAGPWFEKKNWNVGLNPNCADFVDVWHTHGDGGLLLALGTMKPLGHVDFYPNGGAQQPGCRITDLFKRRGSGTLPGTVSRTIPKRKVDLLLGCSHMRVLDFFEESINSEIKFRVTKKCWNQRNIPRSCRPCDNDLQTMGPEAETLPGRGLFWLRTNASPPFARGTQGSRS